MKNLVEIVLLCVCLCYGCSNTPQKIERYIKKHCNFEESDTCYIDLQKALKVDYDTMYVFSSLTPLTVVRNILGINDYGRSEDPEFSYIVFDSESCRIVLVKNHKVVYEDEYCYWSYNTGFHVGSFTFVKGQGRFDGRQVEEEGCIYPNYIFKVVKFENNKRFIYRYVLFPIE